MSDCLNAVLRVAPVTPSPRSRRASGSAKCACSRSPETLGLGSEGSAAARRIRPSPRIPVWIPVRGAVAIQVSRLNKALLGAHTAMTCANLEAVGRVVRIVRELDRQRGFVAAKPSLPDPSRSEASGEGPAAFSVALFRGSENALQAFEKIEFTPGDIEPSRETQFPLAPHQGKEGWPPDVIPYALT